MQHKNIKYYFESERKTITASESNLNQRPTLIYRIIL